jgi:DNA-binding FadR family transcriptional regulator
MAQWQQRQQNFKDLFSSLKAGDLAGAQKAMSALSPNGQPSSGPMAAIYKALQNGDLQSAQQAAQGMHHHHHASGGAQPTATTTASTSISAQISGLGSQVNTSA